MSNRLLICLSVIIITATNVHPNNNYQSLSFGNYCGRNTGSRQVPCDDEALLECNPHGTCRCIEPRIMTFDGSSCVILAGESCQPTDKVWLLDNISKYQRADYSFPCVANATCNLENNICECLPNFYKGPDRKCHVKLHGASCQTEADCRNDDDTGETANLICNKRKICECNTNHTIYYSEEQQCRGIVGATCDNFGKPCVPNAQCVGEYFETLECRCSPGFSKAHDGSCLVAFNNECTLSPEKFCNGKEENTVCKEGRCICRSGHDWDETLRKCRYKIGLRCNNNLECGEGMDCDGELVKRCVCKEGYVRVDSKCHPTYGQPCEQKKSSADARKPFQICNPRLSYVDCFNGICQCQPTEYYEQETGVCRGLVDSYCKQWDGDGYCVENSECVLPANHYLAGIGMCRCQGKFKSTESNHCVEEN